MKRLLRTGASSLVFLSVSSLTCYAVYFLNIQNFWLMFGIASAVLVLGVALGFIRHVAAKVVAFFVNAVAMGLYLQSWYVNRGFYNPLWMMLWIAVMATAYLAVFALPLLIPAVNNHYGTYLTVFAVLSLGGYVALLVLTTTTWVSTLGFFGLLQMSFILGSSFDCDDWEDEMVALWISSYSVILCAVLILVIVLSGDGCDCDYIGMNNSDFTSPVKRNDLSSPATPTE